MTSVCSAVAFGERLAPNSSEQSISIYVNCIHPVVGVFFVVASSCWSVLFLFSSELGLSVLFGRFTDRQTVIVAVVSSSRCALSGFLSPCPTADEEHGSLFFTFNRRSDGYLLST